MVGRSLPYAESAGQGPFARQVKRVAGIFESDSLPAASEKLEQIVAALLGREHVVRIVALRHDAAAPVDRRRRRAGCVADRDRGLLQQLKLQRTLQDVERIAGEEETWLEGRVVTVTPEFADVARIAKEKALPVREVLDQARAEGRRLLSA